jgi:hypothetical protein
MNEFMDDTLSFYGDFTSLIIQDLAKQNGVVYMHVAGLDPDETGMYNNPKMSGLETDRLRFSIGDCQCEYYIARVAETEDESLRYVSEDQVDMYSDKYSVLVYSIKLPFAVPSIYIESRISSWRAYKLKKRLPQKMQSVELEGDFSQFFTVYIADKSHATLAFEVLAPDIMYQLLTLNDDIDVEFAGDRIYFYKFINKKWRPGFRSTKLVSWQRRTTLKKDEYLKYFDFYMSTSRKFIKTARLVKLDTAAQTLPLYKTAEWPKRSRLPYEARQALVAYLLPTSTICLFAWANISGAIDKNQDIIGLTIFSVGLILPIIILFTPYDMARILRILWQKQSTKRLRRKLVKSYEEGVVSEVRIRS